MVLERKGLFITVARSFGGGCVVGAQLQWFFILLGFYYFSFPLGWGCPIFTMPFVIVFSVRLQGLCEWGLNICCLKKSCPPHCYLSGTSLSWKEKYVKTKKKKIDCHLVKDNDQDGNLHLVRWINFYGVRIMQQIE
jgi:hypothetical protein